MDRAALTRRFQLLLSWREKARRLLEDTLASRRDDAGDPAHLHALANLYQGQLRQAEAALTQARDEFAPQAAAAGGRLQTLLASEKHDAAKLASAREEIAFYNRILTAESPEALGGFVDRGLEEYAAAAVAAPAKAPLRRRLPLGGLPPLERQDYIVLGMAAIGVVIAIVAVWTYVRWENAVRFEILAPEPRNGLVRVRCHNDTAAPILLTLPWQAQDSLDAPRSRTYGIDIHARTKGDSEFRLLPVTEEFWHFEGAPTALSEAIEVMPGLWTEVTLQLAPLLRQGGRIEEIRILCRRADGKIFEEASVDLLSLEETIPRNVGIESPPAADTPD